jgi:acyl-CoA thioester hydrolase
VGKPGLGRVSDVAAPLKLLETTVAPEWIDFNGHMNDAAYAIVFSRAIDRFVDRIGLDEAARRASGRTIYTLQLMIHYFHEARLGDPVLVTAHLLEHDAKRFRIFEEMTLGRGGPRLAACEQLLVCVDQSGAKPRSAEFPEGSLATLAAIQKAHAALPLPREAGLGIALRRR